MLWMDEILHHLETMGNRDVCWYLQKIRLILWLLRLFDMAFAAIHSMGVLFFCFTPWGREWEVPAVRGVPSTYGLGWALARWASGALRRCPASCNCCWPGVDPFATGTSGVDFGDPPARCPFLTAFFWGGRVPLLK